MVYTLPPNKRATLQEGEQLGHRLTQIGESHKMTNKKNHIKKKIMACGSIRREILSTVGMQRGNYNEGHSNF